MSELKASNDPVLCAILQVFEYMKNICNKDMTVIVPEKLSAHQRFFESSVRMIRKSIRLSAEDFDIFHTATINLSRAMYPNNEFSDFDYVRQTIFHLIMIKAFNKTKMTDKEAKELIATCERIRSFFICFLYTCDVFKFMNSFVDSDIRDEVLDYFQDILSFVIRDIKLSRKESNRVEKANEKWRETHATRAENKSDEKLPVVDRAYRHERKRVTVFNSVAVAFYETDEGSQRSVIGFHDMSISQNNYVVNPQLPEYDVFSVVSAIIRPWMTVVYAAGLRSEPLVYAECENRRGCKCGNYNRAYMCDIQRGPPSHRKFTREQLDVLTRVPQYRGMSKEFQSSMKTNPIMFLPALRLNEVLTEIYEKGLHVYLDGLRRKLK